MSKPNDWLMQTVEVALDPQRPIIDPHHHLWDFETSTYLATDLAADMGAHNIRQTVFVECGAEYAQSESPELAPVGETVFVEQQSGRSAAGTNIAAGIVGFADMQLGDAVGAVLDAHLRASPRRFRGIRHCCAWHSSAQIRESHSNPPPHLFLLDDFREGIAQLEQRELLFEAWGFHTQINELTDLARAFPGTQFILDHVGGPLGIGPYAGKREEVFLQWKDSMAQLARCANVAVKLGGLGMPLNGFGWHKQSRPPGSDELTRAWAPYFDYCIAQFGAERCMFESNFPVDKASCSYTVLWNAFKKMAANYTAREQDALLHDNAARLYRLA